MKKQGCLLIVALAACLSGCIGTVWTGASLVYDRHAVYNSLSDYKLAAAAGHLLSLDKTLTQAPCFFDIAVFNGDILLLGHLPTEALRKSAVARLDTLSGYRALYNQITVSEEKNNGMVDSWITTKIRSRIFADSTIAPKDFKVVTFDAIVYLMGDVRENQAVLVIEIARSTDRVRRVVNLLHVLSDTKARAKAVSTASSLPSGLSDTHYEKRSDEAIK